MTDNSRQIIERIQSSFPHIYDVYNKNTILYALISVFGERCGMRTDIIDRLYAMLGIDSTYDEDLEHRWGALLGIYRNVGESYDDYRSRLSIVYSSLAGGTAEAIKYAIASVIGITSKPEEIDKYIKVYDAWEYPYDVDETVITDTSYGHVICTVDMFANENAIFMHDKVAEAVNATKASGVYVYLLFMYTAEEHVSLSCADSHSDQVITVESGYDDDILIAANDELSDRSVNGDLDSQSIRFDNSNAWTTEGTNSHATTNGTFVTNTKVESDEFYDKIV